MNRRSISLATLLYISAIFLISCGGSSSSQQASTSGGGTSTLAFQVTDSCDDGSTVYYRFFDETDNLLWPSVSTYYYATQGQTSTSNLQCKTGANICFGASENTNTDSPYWGVGSNNSEVCTNCCVTCAAATVTTTLNCSWAASTAADRPDHPRYSSKKSTALELDGVLSGN